MSSEAEMVIEIWDNIKENIKSSDRKDVATCIIQAMLNYGFDYAELATIEDEDEMLGEILRHLCDIEPAIEDNEEWE